MWLLRRSVSGTVVCVLQRTFEFAKNDNEKVKEDVGVNVKENYVLYHMTDDDTEVAVIEDFNRVMIDKISLFWPILSKQGSRCSYHG